MYAIRVTFQPATDYRGAKLVATTADRKRVVIGYPHHLHESEKYPAAARALCEKWGWTGRLVGANLSDSEMVFVFDPASSPSTELTFASGDDRPARPAKPVDYWAFLDVLGDGPEALRSKAVDALREIIDDADNTGCEGCFVVSDAAISAAAAIVEKIDNPPASKPNSKPAKRKKGDR